MQTVFLLDISGTVLGYNHGSCFCLVQLLHQPAPSADPQILQCLSQAGGTWSPKPPPLGEPTTLLGQLNTRGTPSAQFSSAQSLPPLLNVWWAVSEAVNIARDGVTAVSPWRKEINVKSLRHRSVQKEHLWKKWKAEGKSGLLKLLHMFSIIQNELLYLAGSHGNQRV